MPTNTNVQSTAAGVINHAVGNIVTTSAAAAAVTITLGFIPRVFRIHNLTDRISDEWYDGLDEMGLYTSLLGINAKLDADAGVTATDYAATCNPAGALLSQLETAVELLTAKLDAGAGVTDTDYAALWNPAAPTVAAIKASIAGIAAKLDADAGVTDTDYAALWAMTAPSLHTVAAGTRTLDLDVGPVVGTDGTVTLSATTMVASKVFSWEAIG